MVMFLLTNTDKTQEYCKNVLGFLSFVLSYISSNFRRGLRNEQKVKSLHNIFEYKLRQ